MKDSLGTPCKTLTRIAFCFWNKTLRITMIVVSTSPYYLGIVSVTYQQSSARFSFLSYPYKPSLLTLLDKPLLSKALDTSARCNAANESHYFDLGMSHASLEASGSMLRFIACWVRNCVQKNVKMIYVKNTDSLGQRHIVTCTHVYMYDFVGGLQNNPVEDIKCEMGSLFTGLEDNEAG